jgi:hypothetical protein
MVAGVPRSADFLRIHRVRGGGEIRRSILTAPFPAVPGKVSLMHLELEDDDVSASGIFGGGLAARLEKLKEALAERGIRLKTSWLPMILAILAAMPDIIAAIEEIIRIIEKIRNPAPAPTA